MSRHAEKDQRRCQGSATTIDPMSAKADSATFTSTFTSSGGRGSTPHLAPYFERPKNQLPFAWAAQCGSLLRRRRRLMELRDRHLCLAKWLDAEDGKVRLRDSLRRWNSITRGEAVLEAVAKALQRRYLLRAMHRWFDFFPICTAARICDRVFRVANLQQCFVHWRQMLLERKRMLRAALIGRARRALQKVGLCALIWKWRTNGKVCQQAAALIARAWRRFLVRCHTSSNLNEAVPCTWDHLLLKVAEAKMVDEADVAVSAERGEAKCDDSDDSGTENDCASSLGGMQADDERDLTSSDGEAAVEGGGVVVDVHKLLHRFCVAIDAQLLDEAAAIRKRLDMDGSQAAMRARAAADAKAAAAVEAAKQVDQETIVYEVLNPRDAWAFRQDVPRGGVPRVAADAARDAAAIAQAHLELAGDRADHGVQANNTRATNEVAQHRIFSREKRWVATVPARNALEVEEQSRRHVHGMDRDRNVPLAKCSNHQLRLLHSKMRQRQLQLRQERALLHGQSTQALENLLRQKLVAACYAFRRDWRLLFRRLDRNGSGMLDLTEFRLALRKFARVPASMFSNRDVADLFAAVDTSRNGRMNAAEFAAFVRLGTDPIDPAPSATAMGGAGSGRPHDASRPDWTLSTRESLGSTQRKGVSLRQEDDRFDKLAQRAVFAGPINDATSLYIREYRKKQSRPQDPTQHVKGISTERVVVTPATPADFIVEAAVGSLPPNPLHSAAGRHDTNHCSTNLLVKKEPKKEQTQVLPHDARPASDLASSDQRPRAKERPHMPLPDDAAAAEVRGFVFGLETLLQERGPAYDAAGKMVGWRAPVFDEVQTIKHLLRELGASVDECEEDSEVSSDRLERSLNVQAVSSLQFQNPKKDAPLSPKKVHESAEFGQSAEAAPLEIAEHAAAAQADIQYDAMSEFPEQSATEVEVETAHPSGSVIETKEDDSLDIFARSGDAVSPIHAAP